MGLVLQKSVILTAVAVAPGPVKVSHKKMATDGGYIDFMFLAHPYPTAGSATV